MYQGYSIVMKVNRSKIAYLALLLPIVSQVNASDDEPRTPAKTGENTTVINQTFETPKEQGNSSQVLSLADATSTSNGGGAPMSEERKQEIDDLSKALRGADPENIPDDSDLDASSIKINSETTNMTPVGVALNAVSGQESGNHGDVFRAVFDTNTEENFLDSVSISRVANVLNSGGSPTEREGQENFATEEVDSQLESNNDIGQQTRSGLQEAVDNNRILTIGDLREWFTKQGINLEGMDLDMLLEQLLQNKSNDMLPISIDQNENDQIEHPNEEENQNENLDENDQIEEENQNENLDENQPNNNEQDEQLNEEENLNEHQDAQPETETNNENQQDENKIVDSPYGYSMLDMKAPGVYALKGALFDEIDQIALLMKQFLSHKDENDQNPRLSHLDNENQQDENLNEAENLNERTSSPSTRAKRRKAGRDGEQQFNQQSSESSTKEISNDNQESGIETNTPNQMESTNQPERQNMNKSSKRRISKRDQLRQSQRQKPQGKQGQGINKGPD